MSRRIIKFGKWNDQDLEWEVLKENKFELLVICRTAIVKRRFNGNSSYNGWIKSELRNFLQEEFYKKAFSIEEKQRIINTKLSDVEDSKDNVFILSRKEVETLLTDGDDYEENGSDCSYCVWTRTKDGSGIDHGFASGCWCSHSSTDSYYVRPAMYLKKN